jgi:hypothetical protein
MTDLSSTALCVLAALRENREDAVETDAQGHEWRDCFLDDALAQLTRMSPGSFAGHLAALAKAGLYRKVDSAVGLVRLDWPPPAVDRAGALVAGRGAMQDRQIGLPATRSCLN